MQLQDMLLTALPAHAARILASAGTPVHPVMARASLGIPDTLAIFVVALVVFGPKRLPEIGKQIGKLVFEFRRASNDFKLQIEEELRLAEQQDRQKVIDMQATAAQPATPVALSAESTTSAVSSEATAGVEGSQSTEPQPPDRRAGVNGSDGTSVNGSFPGTGMEAGTHSQEATSSVSPAQETATPLTIHPPSTGTLVSSLPPNHAAKNVMTAIPPAGAPPEAEAGPTEATLTDTTVHNG